MLHRRTLLGRGAAAVPVAYRAGMAAPRAKPPPPQATRGAIETIKGHEDEHAEALGDLFETLGGRLEPPPPFDFGDAFSSEERFLEVAEELGETGIGAYNGAGPQLNSRDILRTAGGIVQVEARHAAVIRRLRGRDEAPRPFDRPLTVGQVRQRVGEYVR